MALYHHVSDARNYLLLEENRHQQQFSEGKIIERRKKNWKRKWSRDAGCWYLARIIIFYPLELLEFYSFQLDVLRLVN